MQGRCHARAHFTRVVVALSYAPIARGASTRALPESFASPHALLLRAAVRLFRQCARHAQAVARDAGISHEVARRGPAVEDAHPLEPLLVVVAQRLPALAREAGEVLGYVDSTRRTRTAHALSSRWPDRGSRAPSVRLLALL